MSHESLAVFLPYIICIALLIENKEKIQNSTNTRLYIAILILINLISFAISIYNSKIDKEHIYAILISLEKSNYGIHGGIFNYLDKSIFYGIDKLKIHIKSYITWYPIAILWIVICFLPLYPILKDMLFKHKELTILILVSIIGTIPMFIVAIDWGRWIYIHAVSIFFLCITYFLLNQEYIEIDMYDISKFLLKIKYISFTLLFFTTFLIYLPHCCNPCPYRNLYNINYVSLFLKFFMKIIFRR